MVTEQLTSVFAALAHPTRRDILDRLAGGAMTAGDVAAPYPVSGAAVSQHLAVLERAGLIVRTPRAQWREISLRAAALDEAAEWVNRHREEWTRRLDRLEARIDELNSHRSGHDASAPHSVRGGRPAPDQAGPDRPTEEEQP